MYTIPMSVPKLGEFNHLPPGQPPTGRRFSGLELEEEGTFQGAWPLLGRAPRCWCLIRTVPGCRGWCIERRNKGFFLDVLVWVLSIYMYIHIHIAYILHIYIYTYIYIFMYHNQVSLV